ncbi:uncharacterized protein LOC122527172 [Frieseomelitta varia]|nr:uncharacterized protein LOC122527172 [Frieseomelitta varia]
MQRQDERPDEGRRVFELSDERCKMALRKQLDLDSLSTEQDNAAEDVEALQKLPAGTIVIKREKRYKDDSDYVRDSTETSSGVSSSSSGVTKVKRVHRTARKNRGAAEIRRNPTRVTKRDSGKDSFRPRQRLLSAKRKEMLFNSEPIRRGKASTMPYMNTRSVTRKMYNVGATYQAPTIRDETEWKEWPVHGMHERPVFHPQVGLAAEYLGRYFTSLDGLSYREIIDRPEIEVVSVDPHCDCLPSSAEKKCRKKVKSSRSSAAFKNGAPRSTEPSERDKSFETCMHESFHCVLGYCSQIMAPSYKANVEGKMNALDESKSLPDAGKEAANVSEPNSKTNASASFKENLQKPAEENKFLDNCGVTLFPQNVKGLAQVPKTRLFPAQKIYIANSQKSIAFTNLKTFQGGHMKIQEVVRSSKSPFILVNPLEAKDAQLLKPGTSSQANANKMEESSTSEETLGEVTSIYKNVSNEEMKQPPGKRGSKMEFTMTKYLHDNMQQSKAQSGKEPNSVERRTYYETTNKKLNLKTMSGGLSKSLCTGDTSEIAKILSEYNKNNLKKSATESQTSWANMKNIRVKELYKKEEKIRQNVQESSADRNVNITFPQGKWRRFHLTVEKLKDLKSNSSDKRHSLGIPNKQSLFKIDQTTTGETSSDKRTEVSKQSETVKKGQSSATNLERKENTSTTNSSVNSAIAKTQSLQELLENTAMLYCAATGTHQDDLANYIDNLDAAQSMQWLEACNDLTV